ncbi:MAG: amidohydrolase [Proteobacteria bacterium]|nr:amidohydrolase [Pseudomonadota bacterium]
MDTIFYNGKINTLDQSGTVCTAVRAINGTISALGSVDEMRSFATPKTEMVDLKGAVMFPGFMEAHNHLSIFGYLNDGLNLTPPDVTKIDDILMRVKGRAEELPAGAWIKGSCYAEYFLAENRHPTRWDLDKVSSKHPVVLFHTSFHACVLNSLALESFNITVDTPSPEGGLIEKNDTDGEPTGVLHDAAMNAVLEKLFVDDLEQLSRQEQINLCSKASKKFASLGYVFAADALVTPQTLSMYQEAEKAGQLKIRIYTMNHAPTAEALVNAKIKTGFGSGRLVIGPIKLFQDGGMSNRTAAVSSPYLTPPYGKGLKIQSREKLIELVAYYHNLGYQIAIHGQGDDSIGDILDAYEGVLGPDSNNPLRHRIEHAGCLYPNLLKRAGRMGILSAVQPVFFGYLGDGFIEAFGSKRANQLYPFKSMLAAGMKLGGSSDCPVANLDPRLGLHGAVKRQTPSGAVLGREEALTMDQALRLYTQGSAYLSFDENRNGSIEIGKRADFTVMEEDPRKVPLDEVPKIPFSMTVVDGEIVWSNFW